MPDIFKIIILAMIQGLTEFLPVSSSGHLGLAQHFLDFDAPGILFEVMVHAGTLVSVLFYYRKRLARILLELPQPGSEGQREALLLLAAVIPVALVGLLGKSRIEALFNEPRFIAVMLGLMGIVLLSLFFARSPAHSISLGRAILIGLAQAIAILPGISRSGMTITTARHLGVEPESAAEFSLLLMVPAVGGAMLLSAGDAMRSGLGNMTIIQVLLAFVVSALVGYGAIVILVRTLRSGHFKWFGFYCVLVSIVAMLMLKGI
jgi:undecaprenyl-diphosphatase